MQLVFSTYDAVNRSCVVSYFDSCKKSLHRRAHHGRATISRTLVKFWPESLGIPLCWAGYPTFCHPLTGNGTNDLYSIVPGPWYNIYLTITDFTNVVDEMAFNIFQLTITRKNVHFFNLSRNKTRNVFFKSQNLILKYFSTVARSKLLLR